MKQINTKNHDGIEIKKFIKNVLKDLLASVNEVEFELTTDDGKTLHHKAINKIKFSVRRK